MSVPHQAQVLLVEDDADTREVLRLILESDGLQVTVAGDGFDALERLREIRRTRPGAPCVIVLDLMMPRCSGPQFRRLQLEAPDVSDVPVILLSAVADLQSQVDSLRPFAILQKPVEVEDLTGAVQAACRAHQRLALRDD